MTQPVSEDISQLDFEDAFEQLKSESSKLQYGRLRLDDMLTAHQRAKALYERCYELLEQARLQVSVVEANTIRESSAIYQVGLLATGLADKADENEDEDDEDEDEDDEDAIEEASH